MSKPANEILIDYCSEGIKNLQPTQLKTLYVTGKINVPGGYHDRSRQFCHLHCPCYYLVYHMSLLIYRVHLTLCCTHFWPFYTELLLVNIKSRHLTPNEAGREVIPLYTEDSFFTVD